MGPGSDLPDFANLVQHVYDAKRIEPDAVEKEALDIGALDKALGLLERDERLGARAVRRTVIERLSAPPSGELNVHKALIDLSQNEQGFRLITTNFDDRLVEAGLDKEVDAAPKLPVPKPHTCRWIRDVHDEEPANPYRAQPADRRDSGDRNLVRSGVQARQGAQGCRE